ncbi:MAG: glycosyltransferase family 4 protein, partial [Candidatus Methanomethylicia archaeon]
KFNVPIIQRISNFRWVCPKGILFRKGKICELCVKKNFFYPSVIFGCYHKSKIASLIFSLSFYFYKLKGAFLLIDKIIFPTKFIQDYYLKSLNFLSKNNTEVIPNFVLLEKKYSGEIHNNIGNYFIYIGRLSEEKGLIWLLDTFKLLTKFKLLVIGDGPLRGEIINKYKRFKNIEFKTFLNKRQLRNYLSKAMFTIIPSIGYDVFPNVMLESFAAGVPVIVPRTINFRSLIEEDVTGVFYEPNSKRSLVAKIENILKKKFLIKKMKKNVLKKIRKNCNFHYKQVISLYKRSLNNLNKN